VRTARAEVTDRMLIAGPRRLRVALEECAAHYNQHRPHRARGLRPPDGDGIITAPVPDLATARIRRHSVLGGADPRVRTGRTTSLWPSYNAAGQMQ